MKGINQIQSSVRKCRLVLSYDAWEETMQQQEQQKLNMDKVNEALEQIAELKKSIGLQ